jgi:ATP-binding cassette subfamily F protein uup
VAILVNAHQLKKAYASRALFDSITFSIESGERVGLIGPNGAGKSTLLKILAGEVSPDEGTLSLQRGLRVGYLAQVPSFKPGSTVMSAVLEGASEPDHWEAQALAQEMMSKLSLTGAGGTVGPETPVTQLSGGWKKRVALARELVRQPDLLLLDEPTNHLDVDSILWLEEFLERAPFAVLTITHDRLFLQRVSNRILELDRRNANGLLSIDGSYDRYLEIKADLMASQEAREVRLKNTLRRETEWLRRGAKARTTKQQARIHRAAELKDEVSELGYRNRVQEVRIDFQGAEKNPKKLLQAKGISKSYDGRVIVPPIDLLMTPQTRLGLLGPNGCGKSTLIRLLVGGEASDTGSVTRSEHLKVNYFEQNRESLDPSVSVLRTVCPTGDHVTYRGERVHVKGYLDRFLFTYGQMEMEVGKLSGGEQSRLLLAKLMLLESNLLVLDEPTNDLDLATLNVLEEMLQEFPGAVVLVTHDRFFLDQVVNQLLVFTHDHQGKRVIQNFAGLSQWETWREEEQENARVREVAARAKQQSAAANGSRKTAKKLSFKEQRELDSMEENIQKAEERLAALEAESARPELATNSIKLAEITRALSEAQAEVDRLYARWSELSS